MRPLLIALFVLLGAVPGQGAVEVWWQWLSPDLRRLEERSMTVAKQLDALGMPVIGQTTPQLGYQHPRLNRQPETPVWVQIDLKESQWIDTVVLVPAQVDWQSMDHTAYGFPLRFQVALSDDKSFKTATPAASFTNNDFPNPGIAPVTIPVPRQKARYLRFTVTKLAEENNQYFYALSEIMALSGNLNVALGCPVRPSATAFYPPRWRANNLVDGQTPLGPPIRREILEWDGLYARPTPEGSPAWMAVDLGRVCPVQQIRLYAVHARLGADVPGLNFPKRLRLEVSESPDFNPAVVLSETNDYANPGNNPVTIRGQDTPARYVRITALEYYSQNDQRFGLSEIEVYSGGTNVARGTKVTRTPDKNSLSKNWPDSLLVDGFTSYGRLLELPDWLHGWEERRRLQNELKEMTQREQLLVTQAHRRAGYLGAGTVAIFGLILVSLAAAAHARRERELHDLRLRLARDLHDEIGSNLAGLAVLSEVAHDNNLPEATRQADWREVNEIARESMGAMREVIWLVGGREEAGLDLIAHLQLAATRILTGREVIWKARPTVLPAGWTMETQRQIFLFFKEALANIVRHSQATRVEISAEISAREFTLRIADNGTGFDIEKIKRGVGLTSQEMRARSLGGKVEIISQPGHGAQIELKIPLKQTRRFFSFWKSGRNAES